MIMRMGLQTKIILLVLCGLLIVFGVFSYLALQMLGETTQQSLEEQLDAAKLVASYTDEQVRIALTMLEKVATPSALDLSRSDSETGRLEISRLFRQSSFSSYGVLVLDKEGKIVWEEPSRAFGLGSQLPGTGRLIEGLRQGRSQVSDLIVEPRGRSPLVVLAVPIVDRYGSFVGAVGSAADLGSRSLSSLVEWVALGRTSTAEIIDGGGRVLAGTDQQRLFQRDDHAGRFFALIHEQQAEVGRCYRCHESVSEYRQNDVLAFSPLQRAPWGIAIRQLEDEVLAPTREMTKRIILVAVPLFAGALALAWITTSRVVGPIRALTTASRRIASGDLDFAVAPAGKDELGVLAASFDSMRQKLKTSYHEVEALNRDLEQRVDRRSRDLYTIFETSQIAASSLDVDTLLGEIVARLVMVVRPAGAGVLYLALEDEQALVPRCSHGYEHAKLAGARIVPGEGIAGKVYRSEQALLWPDAAAVAGATADLSRANAALWQAAIELAGQPCASIGVPLVSKGKTMGCIVLDSFQPEPHFTQDDLALVRAIGDRLAVAIENARLYEEVQRKEQLRGQLLEKVMVAQEEERKRIARELHDETGQSLTALAISLASAQEQLPEGANGASDLLEQGKFLAEKLLAEIRRLISDLRPTILDDLGLVPALRRYSSTHADLLGLDIKLHVEGRRRRLSAQAETALFRMVQEAITNVAKHARARHVTVSLTFEPDRVVVAVRDDGQGFNVSHALSAGSPDRGMGLLGMRERVTLLGGTLEITSTAAGTVLVASLPLELEEAYVND